MVSNRRIPSTSFDMAQVVIDRAERIALSERDSLRVLELLENPAVPNIMLTKASRALPRASRKPQT